MYVFLAKKAKIIPKKLQKSIPVQVRKYLANESEQSRNECKTHRGMKIKRANEK